MADINRFRQAIASDRTWRIIKLMLLGATGFWLPDTAWHAVKGMDFNGADDRAITLIMPLSLLVTYVLARRLQRKEPRQSVGWPFMVGVWLLGGIFIMIGASFSGGGFAGLDGIRGAAIVLLLSIVPIYLFIMATYDGSLAALLAVSIIAGVTWFIQYSRKSGSQESNARDSRESV
jgi:hypothetical protein